MAFDEIKKVINEYDHIIWDWNGTLLNDLDVAISAVTPQLKQFDLPIPSKETYRENFGFPVKDYYTKLGFRFDKVSYGEIADQFIKNYEENLHLAEIYQGTEELLAHVKEQGKQQSVLSAASQEHLNMILPKFKVHHYFDRVFGLSDNQAGSKVARGHQLMEKTTVPPERTLLIGDTDHDYEVGEALGVAVLLIADGHQNFERLQKMAPRVIPSRYIEAHT